MDFIKNFRNELFKRQEIEFILESDKNPSFEEMKEKISKELSKPVESLDVYSIKGSFGSNKFLICAHVYDSKEAREKAIQKSSKQIKEEKKVIEEAKKKADEDSKKAAEPVVAA